jgi:hypothetical protein
VSRALLLAPLFLLAFNGCHRAGGENEGSGTSKTEARPVTGFTQVTIAAAGDVTITQSGADSLTIEADDNLLPLLTSEVAGGRLTLGVRGSITPKQPIRYRITVRELTGIDVSGAANVDAKDVATTALTVGLSGAGNVTVAGQAQREDISVSGAGRFDGAGLAVKSARAILSGAGSAVVQAKDELDATVTGVGSVEYVGAPKVKQNVTGIGTVHAR